MTEKKYIFKQLLSLFYSGVYISAIELTRCARDAGIDVRAKKRDHLMYDISSKASEEAFGEFMKNIETLLESRIQEYKKMESRYNSSAKVITPWLKKLYAIKHQLHKEIL